MPRSLRPAERLEDVRHGTDLVPFDGLVVLVPGMGSDRAAYRFLAPHLAAAGHRVAVMDLRGHGDSSLGWPSYTRTDTARDILALIRRLGGPGVIVGNSFSGGSATIAAAQQPTMRCGRSCTPGVRT